MKRGGRRTGISAADLMAELQNDPEYQRKIAAVEAECQEHVRRLREAEQPVVADLRDAGVQVDSVWDLVNTSEPYPVALPVLMEHLERGSTRRRREVLLSYSRTGREPRTDVHKGRLGRPTNAYLGTSPTRSYPTGGVAQRGQRRAGMVHPNLDIPSIGNVICIGPVG